MTDILIVGAGLLGASVGHRLAAQGARVTIVEAVRPGAGTSGNSFAWLNAQEKSPPAYFQINQDGMRGHRELADELGGDWYHSGGDISIGRGEGAAKTSDKIERHRAMGYAVETLDRAGIQRLEPDLDLGDDPHVVGAHFADEAWIDPLELIDRL
ncbi:MAG: NAD(P)/FAD-dependent oxidoreductase, partial [Candidatus Limnocylindrales bacterium]